MANYMGQPNGLTYNPYSDPNNQQYYSQRNQPAFQQNQPQGQQYYPQQGTPRYGGGGAYTQSPAGQPAQQSFGDLSNPQNWMNLVNNNQQLDAWIQQNYPNMSQGDRQYFIQHIQEKPGANPTEQAGSANYWLGRMTEAPSVGGSSAGGGSGLNYPGAVNQSLGGYSNFALTGGYSPQDLQDIRARAASAVRSSYSNAQDELERAKNLAGPGGLANFAASQAKMKRDQSINTADALTNANANIAQMVQQGKLAGLSGLSQTGLLGQGQNLAALQGMTGAYGAAPGLTNTYINPMVNSASQMNQWAGLNNQLNLGLVGANQNRLQMPSDFQTGLNYVGQIAQYAPMLAAFA